MKTKGEETNETIDDYFDYFNEQRNNPFSESSVTNALNKLMDDERNIFIIYLNLGSIKRTSEYFNCSSSFMGAKIKEIKEHIKNKL